ncbi:unnamed protein product, partial [Brachionus calyciflorus]
MPDNLKIRLRLTTNKFDRSVVIGVCNYVLNNISINFTKLI